MVTELCSGGDLFDRVIARGQLPERQVQGIMHKLFQAVNHMHASGIVHRDIKPENILFVDNTERSDIKLIDFGLSAIFG
jgi:serine/threonine protein kinase